jgi:hypothetical protein
MADGPSKENALVVPPIASHPERRGRKRVVTHEEQHGTYGRHCDRSPQANDASPVQPRVSIPILL